MIAVTELELWTKSGGRFEEGGCRSLSMRPGRFIRRLLVASVNQNSSHSDSTKISGSNRAEDF